MANFKNLAISQKLSENQYYSVVKIVGNKVQLKNDYGEDIVVDSSYVDKCLTSASEIIQTKSVTKTEAATIFLQNSGVVMTVNFAKQVKEAEVVKEIMDKIADAKLSEIEKAVKEGIKKSITGEPRTMVGRHYGELNELGRVNFVDMEVERKEGSYDNRMKQVDPRTISWIIIRSVKYEVKK